MKYFNELTKAEFKELVKAKITWAELSEKHPQPIWCGYPGAVYGEVGCWSLVGQSIKSENDCDNCECKIDKHQ